MAITYISSTSRPSDGGTFAGNASNVILLASSGATTGDIIIVIAQYRGSTTITINENSGQSWNTLTSFNDAANQSQVTIFWCRVNLATYNGNNPSFLANGDGVTPFTCTGHVFRPTTGTNLWGVDVALTTTQFSAPTTPFTVTRNGVTTTQANTLTIATWHTPDQNTWGSISGTGWSVLGDAQYRNATGSGQSCSLAYKIQTSAGATGNVSKNQATNGGDAGVTGIVSFYEYAAGGPISGASSGTSTPTSTILGVGSIASLSAGQSFGSSTITGTGQITGLASGTSIATSNITGYGYLSGVSSGSSTATIVKLPSGENILLTGRSKLNTSMRGNSYLTSTVTGTSRIKRIL